MDILDNSHKRLVKNTLFLYGRTLLLLIIGIFTSRITLQALGIDNYGTINVVGGFVSMFSLVSVGLTAACQRFLTVELGKRTKDINNVFNTSVHIHIWLCLIIFLLAESIGLYFVKFKLDIPSDIRPYVQWVYQCSVISFMLSLINIPYNGLIIAYERFNIFALMSMLEGCLKFAVVFLLLYLPGQKLIIYSVLSLTSGIIVLSCYQIYTRRNFKSEIRFHSKIDKTLGKQIFSFAGWSFIGNSAVIFSNQGVNVLLNIFCGVVVNAARGIAVMVENVITGFVNNFTTALNPQITKAYASGDHATLTSLVNLGLRISFFLMLVFSLPLLFAAPELLQIWFGRYPEYSPVFVRLTLVVATMTSLGNPFLTVILATGKIRKYQIIVGGLTLMNFPLSYLALKFHCSPVSVYIIAMIIVSLTFVIRLIFVHYQSSIRIGKILRVLVIDFVPLVIVGGLTVFVIYRHFVIDSLFKLGLYMIMCVGILCSLIYLIGLNKEERSALLNFLKLKISNTFHSDEP